MTENVCFGAGIGLLVFTQCRKSGFTVIVPFATVVHPMGSMIGQSLWYRNTFGSARRQRAIQSDLHGTSTFESRWQVEQKPGASSSPHLGAWERRRSEIFMSFWLLSHFVGRTTEPGDRALEMIGTIELGKLSGLCMPIILHFCQAFLDIYPRQADFATDLDAVSPLLVRTRNWVIAHV